MFLKQRNMTFKILLLTLTLCLPSALQQDVKTLHTHPGIKTQIGVGNEENSAEFWNTNALNTLKQHLQQKNNENVAKNVILFLGDGMSLPTLTATRIYLGNENVQLSFEKFPHTALAKTYCVDYQVPDSACTATAYLGGVKGNMGTIGVNGNIPYNDCQAMTNTTNHVHSIAQWAQSKGKSAGLVTTARVTDASPAGVYGHTAQRDWETDTAIALSGNDPTICQDLAAQLVNSDVGKQLKVVMGGGRNAFLPKETQDEEGNDGQRSDKVDLIHAWQEQKKGDKATYVWNREQLTGLDKDTDYVLGLFASDHCPYNLERDQDLSPSLSEMTEAAIKVLSRNSKGYFLFVEGARIDMAHHGAMAHLALDETAEFSRAVELALNMTSEEDTLIVVTSDHAHTMSISGYPQRGNGILGVGGEAGDRLPYTTLNYANGPGYEVPNADGSRHDISGDDFGNVEHPYPGGFPTKSESHGGDDVLIFARGPWSHLFSGVLEQNVIPHIIGYASCIGKDGITACGEERPRNKRKKKVLIPLPSIF